MPENYIISSLLARKLLMYYFLFKILFIYLCLPWLKKNYNDLRI